jgi:hypothetical protein
LEQGCRIRLHGTVQQRRTGLVEEADVHGTGMQVDTAGKGVLRSVKSPGGLLLRGQQVFPLPSRPRWSAGEGASISIKGLEPIASSVCSCVTVRHESGMEECDNTFGYTGTH